MLASAAGRPARLLRGVAWVAAPFKRPDPNGDPLESDPRLAWIDTWIDVRVNLHMRVLKPIDFRTRKIDLCFVFI